MATIKVKITHNDECKWLDRIVTLAPDDLIAKTLDEFACTSFTTRRGNAWTTYELVED